MSRSATWKLQQFTQRLARKSLLSQKKAGRIVKEQDAAIEAVRRFLSRERRWEDR